MAGSLRLSRVIALLAAVVYLALTADRLGDYPPVGEDEPWIAAAPYKMATEGVLGSDLFTGYYGAERHHFQHMPVYPLLEAAVFRLFGTGVVQMRLLSATFGLTLLLVVFLVGAQTGDERAGALAVVLLVALRITDGANASGVLLVDRARINRYDIAVPVFGLLALWVFNRHDSRPERTRYWMSGALAALASLSHLFGVFWLPVLLALTAIDRRRRGSIVAGWRWLLTGFAMPWLPWLAFIATAWPDFVGQMRSVAPRLALFDPGFYVANALHGGGPISLDWLWHALTGLAPARIGAWLAVIGLPAAWVVLIREARRDDRALRLVLAATAQLLMFVVLLKVKAVSYMIGLWPLGALVLAWSGMWCWRVAPQLPRLGLAGLLAAGVVEGGTSIARAHVEARQVTPYTAYETTIARCVPPGALVLGLQHYWLGLRQYPYRTWLLPTNLANPQLVDHPRPLDTVLDGIDPDVILIDRHMRVLFEGAADPAHPFHAWQTGVAMFLERRHAKLVCQIPDRTYGRMDVYSVPKR